MTNAPMGILNSSFSELKRMGQGSINRKSKFSFHDSCPFSLNLKQRHHDILRESWEAMGMRHSTIFTWLVVGMMTFPIYGNS